MLRTRLDLYCRDCFDLVSKYLLALKARDIGIQADTLVIDVAQVYYVIFSCLLFLRLSAESPFVRRILWSLLLYCLCRPSLVLSLSTQSALSFVFLSCPSKSRMPCFSGASYGYHRRPQPIQQAGGACRESLYDACRESDLLPTLVGRATVAFS